MKDELLAQVARRHGLKTNLKDSAGRKDLAQQLLTQQVAKLPPFDDAALRDFYKNHGEKFVIAQKVEVREIFLPLQGRPDKRPRTNRAFWVKNWQTAFARVSCWNL